MIEAPDNTAREPNLSSSGQSGSSEVGSKELELLSFLYDKRVELFNYRRDIEWRIFFGAITLYGGVDAALVTQGIRLEGALLYGWWVICVLLFLCCLGFSIDLQRRNRTDRLALNEAQNRICDALRLEPESKLREYVEAPQGSTGEGRWASVWAFRWQMAVLALIALVSMSLPLVVQPTPAIQGNTPANQALERDAANSAAPLSFMR
jgi:hypothetical protein